MVLILQVINSHDQGLHNSINGNERRRTKTKLEARGGKMKSTVGVAPKLNAEEKDKEQVNLVQPANNNNPRKKHPATSGAPILRPQIKDKHLEDKNKDGTATKKRKERIPPGVGGTSGAGRTT